MGDLLPPKVREEVSRLRRRLVELRQHHGIRQDRYNQTIPHGYEQQNQDTLRLHQKLLESRAKKAAKVTKTNKDTSSQPDQRNNPITQQKKRKHDNNSSGDCGGGAANVDAYTFDEPDEPANKALRGNGTGPGNSSENGRGDGGSNNQLHQSVSVNIVQQIDTHADPQTNRIKLTVSSTLQTSGLGSASKGQSVTSTSVETNICKQEPVDNDQCPGSSNSSQNSFHDPIGLEDVDEIKAILDTLEREEGAIPPELIKELDLGFKEGFEDSDSLSSSSHPDTSSKGAELAGQQQPASGLSHRSPMFNSGNHSTKSSPGPGMFADPLYDSSTQQAAPVNPSLSAMGGQGAAAMANYHRPPTGGGAAPPPPILPVGDTGPAAETLKQMAAQHQTQHQNQEAAGGYPMKGQMPYGAPEYVDYQRRYTPHGYPPYPGQNYPMSATAQANMYPYNQQVPMNNHRAGHMAVQSMQGKDPSMNYGGTKPLSHYPGQMGGGGPSSLQQLQNQVQSHFGQGPSQNGAGPGPHLQISQSQHMQMTHGAGAHMQMTQSQQMQIHNASPQISVAQQQSFSMGPQGAAPRAAQYHMNNQMKMQMMNQQQQQQHQQQQAQAQGAPTGGPQPPPGSGPQHPNMQSYMNRPPPEYKVPPGGVNNNYGQNANPLQTMQNMVNQTSQSGPAQNGMYPHAPPGAPGGPGGPPPQQIKTEGMPPTAATGAGANRASPHLTGPPNSSSMGPRPTGSPSGMRTYGQPGGPAPGQMMPGQMPNGTATGTTMKAPTPPNPQFQSAIMRNQRPPNVNVGPDGLNISQQRSHSGEWPRTMNPGGAGAPQQMVVRPGMPGSNMMPYGAGAYQGQGARPMGGHMDAASMRMHMSQQAVMTSGQSGGPMGGSHMHPGMAPGGGSTGPDTMMLQQQQALQVSHGNMAASISQTMSARVSSPQSHPPQQQQPSQQQPQQQAQATPQQQQQRQQPSPQQQHQQSQQQQQPQPQPPQQQQQQQPHHTSQSPHGPHPGYPHQSSTQHPNSEFPLDFLDNAQGNGFFDSMGPHSGDFFDELFGK